MESKQAKIAIIVLNWNTYELTQKCLNSLSKISYANFQIILVDNGSQDGSGVKLNREFNPAKYFSNSKNSKLELLGENCFEMSCPKEEELHSNDLKSRAQVLI